MAYRARSTHNSQHVARELAARIRGEVIRPGDPGYEEAGLIFNQAYAERPACYVRPADTSDVVAAVNAARRYDLPLAIRSGGHSMVGLGLVEDGLVIDLSQYKGVRVDPESKTAHIRPGTTWGEVAAEAQKYGLALSSGDMGTVGVGGLTVGGGIGWLVRKYGLTIDHLLSAEVVTADGRVLVASPTQHADLFWAIRGGGGNFGIVTSFHFQLRPLGLILGGAVFYDGADAETVLRGYLDYAPTAPDELTTMAFTMTAPPAPFIPEHMQGKLVVAVMLAYAGDPEKGQEVVAPLRSLATPVADVIAGMPYSVLFEFTKEGGIKGANHAVRTLFSNRLDDGAVAAIVEHSRAMVSPHAMAQIRTLGGAMSRVPDDETAFSHRDKQFMLTFFSSWLDPAEAETNHRWIHSFWEDVERYADGAYVNFLAEDGSERIREAYKPATYLRLRAIKRRYDPDNVFRRNQNIAPGGVAGERAA